MGPRTPGSEPPATLGGPGWLPRESSHAAEVAAGRLWTRCGYRSEVDPLRTVLLARPPDSLAAAGDVAAGADAAGDAGADPGRQLMLERVDLAAIRVQADAIAAAFRRHQIDVRLVHSPADAPPNIIFMRDLVFMTPEGAVVARTAARQRAGEERHVAEALARAGYPILRTVTGTATFEGADALWLDRDTVMIGVGFRTNEAGAAAVRDVLREQRIGTVTVPLRPGVQHLLGTVVLVDERLAVVHAEAAGPRLRALLRERGYELVELPPDAELTAARGMNLVALGPRRVLMPSGAPGIRRRLETAGVAVEELDVGEYVKAAGGLGCLTAILYRAR